ncbi:MAG: hypothetical protein HN348_18945 [Proteobacteria bacterium]|nr:hypothetical protein [Pseudomonadota bacterium]
MVSYTTIQSASVKIGVLAMVLWLYPLSGCENQLQGRDCNFDADCASGECLPTGVCSPLDDTDDPADSGDTDTDVDGCVPNHDGIITAAETPIQAGFEAKFRVTKNVTDFSSAPDCTSGSCSWDLVDVPGTTKNEMFTTKSLSGTWFEDIDAFAHATHYTSVGMFKLNMVVDLCSQEQLAIYRKDDDALWLLGMVSSEKDGGTQLIYNPPVDILRFPIEAGKTWSTNTTASGPLCGSWVDYDIDQTYTSTVDKDGSLETPYGDFPEVQRVNTLVERHIGVGVMPALMRTHTLMAECFTSVGVILSEEGVENADFDDVLEVRRLTLLTD